MKWPKLTQPALPGSDLPQRGVLTEAASRAVGELRGHPDAVLEALPHNLAREEASALKRGSPKGRKWREIEELDRRVAEFDRRGQAAGQELQRLHEARRLAPERDAESLADWIRKGERGKRPEPSLPGLDREIEGAELERDAIAKASEAALDEKAKFVERHRSRLAREADKRVGANLERIKSLIADVEAKREELIEARHDALWARLYPSRTAGLTPPTSIAGGRRKLLERANIQGQLPPERFYELAVADAEVQASAITDEQAAELGIHGENSVAVWAKTDEGREAERKEKREALERYRREWGREPV